MHSYLFSIQTKAISVVQWTARHHIYLAVSVKCYCYAVVTALLLAHKFFDCSHFNTLTDWPYPTGRRATEQNYEIAKLTHKTLCINTLSSQVTGMAGFHPAHAQWEMEIWQLCYRLRSSALLLTYYSTHSASLTLSSVTLTLFLAHLITNRHMSTH